MRRATCFGAIVLMMLAVGIGLPGDAKAEKTAVNPVGVVSHVKVLSDKVRDVSSMEAWKRSFLRDGMTDEQKAIAVWKSVVMYRHQDAPPIEFLHEGCVHDPIKAFNVYGYGMCCCASSNVEALARYAGLEARGWAVNLHSVPEVFYDGAWHLFDASLINYFPKAEGGIASVEEIVAAVNGWLEKHPECRGATAGGRSKRWTPTSVLLRVSASTPPSRISRRARRRPASAGPAGSGTPPACSPRGSTPITGSRTADSAR